MADILRRVATLTIHRTCYGNIRALVPFQVRTFFSASGIGIDGFNMSRENHATRQASSIDSFKKRFADAIEQPNAQIFTEDLRTAILSANSDQEIDYIIKGLKKYAATENKFGDFRFGSPMMRLLYIHNKTDLAVQLFMDESLKTIFNDSASSLILLNKLIEDQRYDDALKVFEFGAKRGFSSSNPRKYPSDLVMLIVEALYRMNTKESLSKVKDLLSKVKAANSDINLRAASMASLLAIQQGESSFAMEVLTAVRGQTLSTIQNLRAICYADMGRVEEAINVIQLLAERFNNADERRTVFPLTMRHIRIALENKKDEKSSNLFEEVSKTVMKNNRLSTTDLAEFIMQPINRRLPKFNQQTTRQSNERNTYDGPRRTFDRQSNNMRQGMRTGYNNNNNNDRRFQNSYVDGYRRNYDNDGFAGRNRSSSFNDYGRQDNRFQQQPKRMGNRMNNLEFPSEKSMNETAWANADDVESSRSNRQDSESQKGKRNRGSSDGNDRAFTKNSTWQRNEDNERSSRQSS